MSLRIVTVGKVLGGEWFERMGQGIREIALEDGVDASMVGGEDVDPHEQIRIIEGLIAERPTSITVVPNDPGSLEGVLKRARDAGIIVVTHEASTQVQTDVDIEAFDNAAYGAHMIDRLAEGMGGSGRYVAFIGHDKAQSHIEWVNGAADRVVAAHPAIERLGDPIESFEHAEVAYERTKEILARHPDVAGFLGTGSTDVVGVGRAIQEAGMQDRTCVMGTSIPSMVDGLLIDGSVDRIFFWDPGLAGKAMVRLALMLARDEQIRTGTDLHLPGYHDLQRIADSPRGFHGNAWVEADATNADQYRF